MARRLRRCGWVLAALLGVARGAERPAWAAPVAWQADAWQAKADLVFRPVAQASDEPAMMLPTVMEQDADGFLWAGGQTGLLRWDGYHFTPFTGNGPVPDGLPDHGIASLHRDTAGRLWVGTLAGTLARYDAAADRFVPVPLAADRLGVPCVWSIDDDGRGGLWVATGSGLFHLGRDGALIGRIRHDPARADSLPDDLVQVLLRDPHGHLWVGGRFGLAEAEDAGGDLHFHDVALPAAGGDRAEVSHLLEDSEGRLWIGTRQQGAYVLGQAARAKAGAAARIGATAGDLAGDPPVEVMAIAEVSPGRIWLATFGRGIISVEGAGMAVRRIRHDPLVPWSLGSNSIFSLFVDRSGLAWVGTTVGLSLYNPGSGGIFTFFAREMPVGGGPAVPGGSLGGFDVTSIVARPDGGLWVGSEADGIDVLDASGGRTGNLALQRVFAMEAEGGHVLAGTRAGLYLADPASKRIRRLALPGRRLTAGVFALYRPPDTAGSGIVWLGGGDDGVWGFRLGADGQVAVLRHVDAPALTSPVVHVLGMAPGGWLAAGTENGLNLINRASGAVRQIRHDPADAESLSVGGVESLAIDRMGRLWVGTDTGGINVLVGQKADGRLRFHHIGLADGLPNMDACTMLTDSQGRLWVSTDNGLAVVDPADFAVRALRSADGVAVSAYWDNSGAVMPDGTLVFGGTGGMTLVRPESVARWMFAPPVRITGIRLGGRSVRPRPPADATDGQVADGPPSLEVPPEVKAFSVEFAALDYSAPERNRYRYRLLGFDARWVETDAAHRMAAYTNLPPGDYVLQVEGSNRSGVWTAEPASLLVRVLPAWFETVWCHLAEALALGVAVSGVVQRRTVVLRRRQRDLQRLVDARTDELRCSQKQLHEFAYVDTLTNLPNRRAFNEYLGRMTGARPPASAGFALVLIDLDGFKQVNDTLGHDAGDAVLVEAAARLLQVVREGDFVARLGGDEFSVVLHATKDMATIEAICTRIVDSMAQPLMAQGGFVRIGASLGAALFPLHGAAQDELYKRADLALYAAKHAGKSGWRWYEEAAA